MSLESSTAYDKIFNFEEEGTPIESAGAWESLTKQLGFSEITELRTYVEGKNVLDVGSGMGGLFKEAKIRGVEANIVSLNPRFAIPGHKADAHEMFELMLENVPDNIKEINEAHDKSAVAALSDKLPFAANSFQVVIDNKGAVYHCLYEDYPDEIFMVQTVFNPNRVVLEKTVDEYTRVLTTGGKARIGGLLSEPPEGLALLKEVLESKGISYAPIEDKEGTVISLEIEKK